VTDTSVPAREISATAARTRSAISSAAGPGIGEQDRELLPAVAPGEVPHPQHRSRSTAPTFGQDLVPHRMPPLVVDLLEMVEVEEQQPERRRRRRGLREQALIASVTALLLAAR